MSLVCKQLSKHLTCTANICVHILQHNSCSRRKFNRKLQSGRGGAKLPLCYHIHTRIVTDNTKYGSDHFIHVCNLEMHRRFRQRQPSFLH